MTKLCGAIGFCRKAGKITIGAHDVVEKLHSDKIKLVIVSSDTKKNSLDKVSRLCEIKNVPLKIVGLTKKEMSAAIGLKREIGVLGIPQEFTEIVLRSL